MTQYLSALAQCKGQRERVVLGIVIVVCLELQNSSIVSLASRQRTVRLRKTYSTRYPTPRTTLGEI